MSQNKMIQFIWTLLFFSFILSCQSKEAVFQKFVREQLDLLYQTKCNYDINCVEQRGQEYISGKLCKISGEKYREHGFTSDKECIIEAYKTLSERIGKEIRPVLMDCHPGEYCTIPSGCTYEKAIIASKVPGMSCWSSEANIKNR